MTRTPAQAIATVRAQSVNGPAFEVGTCLIQCHDAYGISTDGTGYAALAWTRAKYRHPTSNTLNIPAGAFLFWTGGSKGFGHIAISAGMGRCWSSDISRPGFFDLVSIPTIAEKWPGHTFVGWSEDVDGVRVLTPPPAPPVPLPPTKVTAARHLLGEALATAGPIRKLRIRAGLLQLPKR